MAMSKAECVPGRRVAWWAIPAAPWGAYPVAGEVTAEGDGKCLPTPEDCQTLKLRVGETEFFDVVAPDSDSAEPVQYVPPRAVWEPGSSSRVARWLSAGSAAKRAPPPAGGSM